MTGLKQVSAALAIALSLTACAAPEGVGGYGSKSVIGGLGGAAAGGLLGSQFGHGGGKLAMTGLGVLAGAVTGGAVGSALDRADADALKRNTEAALQTKGTGREIVWDNPRNGHRVAVTTTREGHRGKRYCREFRQTVTIGEKQENAYGHACRKPDGAWEVMG